VVRSETLLEKGFFTVGTKLIHVPGTWSVAPYHVPGDCGYTLSPTSASNNDPGSMVVLVTLGLRWSDSRVS
jgi:hypothetical protein